MSAAVLTIPPKRVTSKYKKRDIIITYNMESREWDWYFEDIRVRRYSGTADSLTNAQLAAQKQVDEISDTTSH